MAGNIESPQEMRGSFGLCIIGIYYVNQSARTPNFSTQYYTYWCSHKLFTKIRCFHFSEHILEERHTHKKTKSEGKSIYTLEESLRPIWRRKLARLPALILRTYGLLPAVFSHFSTNPSVSSIHG